MTSELRQPTASAGALLRREREARGLTLADVARRSGVPAPNLSRIESGVADARLSTFLRVAEALGLDVALEPAGRLRDLADVARDAEAGRRRIIAAGLGGSDPWARLARRGRAGEDVGVEAEARTRAETAPR